MAAQEEGPGELVPQMAQMLYVPALVNGRASAVLPLPAGVVCGLRAGPWLAPKGTQSGGVKSGWEAPR